LRALPLCDKKGVVQPPPERGAIKEVSGMQVRSIGASLAAMLLVGTLGVTGCGESKEATRAEQAAARSEDAARRAEAAAGRVEAAASRAEAAAEKADRMMSKHLRK